MMADADEVIEWFLILLDKIVRAMEYWEARKWGFPVVWLLHVTMLLLVFVVLFCIAPYVKDPQKNPLHW